MFLERQDLCGSQMSQPREVQEFAAHLRILKDHAGRTYEALAKRTGVSSSALHRYCNGKSVPLEFAPLERLARACGASREELRELQQRWFLADAVRKPSAPRAATHPEPPLRGSPEHPPGRTPHPEPDTEADGITATADPAGARPSAAAARRRWLATGLVAEFLFVAAAAMAVGTVLADRPGASSKSKRPMLLSPACPVVLSIGEHDECVRELQRLLATTGTSIDVNGQFGPQTRSRVTAFQVLAGIPPSGVVGDCTKRTLYDSEVKMRSWPPAKVEQRIGEVFPEDPDTAVAIARCQSFLDPFWVLPNEDGSRNWGLFQIRDRRLEQLGGTPLEAFDPEWNIQAARRLWSEHGDFRHWKVCLAALTTPTPSRRPPPLTELQREHGPTERARQRPPPSPRIPSP